MGVGGRVVPEYDKDRERFDNNRRGRIFENGAAEYYRDRERGYSQGSRTFTSPRIGKVKFDKTREVDGRVQAIEEKSGRIEGKKDEKQLKAVRDLLARGTVSQHVLRSVQGEAVSKTCQELINGLARDFPGQFNHQVISRADARQIWALGLQREQGRQLELPGVGEQARQQRQARRHDRAREQDRTREQDRARAERLSREQQVALQRQRAAAERLARSAPRSAAHRRSTSPHTANLPPREAPVAGERNATGPRDRTPSRPLNPIDQPVFQWTGDPSANSGQALESARGTAGYRNSSSSADSAPGMFRARRNGVVAIRPASFSARWKYPSIRRRDPALRPMTNLRAPARCSERVNRKLPQLGRDNAPRSSTRETVRSPSGSNRRRRPPTPRARSDRKPAPPRRRDRAARETPPRRAGPWCDAAAHR